MSFEVGIIMKHDYVQYRCFFSEVPTSDQRLSITSFVLN